MLLVAAVWEQIKAKNPRALYHLICAAYQRVCARWFVIQVVWGVCVCMKNREAGEREWALFCTVLCACVNAQNYTKQCNHMSYLWMYSISWFMCVSLMSVQKWDSALAAAAGPSCSAMKLGLILSLLPPRVINNPARGCQECDCVSTTWTPAPHSLATKRKMCISECVEGEQIRIHNLYICSLCRSPWFCCKPRWATAALYPCDIEDPVCNYYLSNNDLKPS